MFHLINWVFFTLCRYPTDEHRTEVNQFAGPTFRGPTIDSYGNSDNWSIQQAAAQQIEHEKHEKHEKHENMKWDVFIQCFSVQDNLC